jgi:hypothetical protein
MKVFILATCRREDLIPYTLLVFKTFRIGFPTAELHVHTNGTEGSHIWGQTLKDVVEAAGGQLYIKDETTHHGWIAGLVEAEHDAFWLCDTDMVFYRSVEDWKFPDNLPMAGYRVPEFYDEFTKSITRARLHTSLLRIDPFAFRVAWLKYCTNHPQTQFNPIANPFHPVVMPLNGRSYFHDTLSVAYHGIGGVEFTPQQKESYFHFHFGTFSDLVLPKLRVGDSMATMRKAILENPSLGIGMWRMQEEYFANQQAFLDGSDVVAPINQKDAKEAQAWNEALCKGNIHAMQFCDLWYRYCHGIDDLIDTMKDGRPTMSKDQMVSLFFTAALLYNTEFFVQNRNLLCPIVLQVTNTYRDSIAWEQSPRYHLRQMGDVFRTCGNEMYVMVALVCGGEAHMREMSMAIKERDWLGQHDEAGRPV